MAAFSCRVLCAVRWYEVSRVLSVTSTLATTQNYRNEKWCRRWWHASHRSLSLTAYSFAPCVSPILARGMEESKNAKKQTKVSETPKNVAEERSASEKTDGTGADVTVTYHQGLSKITVPLPSRKEQCTFTLRPISHTIGDFITMLKTEDRGIDRATVQTLGGVRIASSNTIESLMEEKFRLLINDNVYLVSPPSQHKRTTDEMQKFADVRTLVGELYESLQVREHYADFERQVLADLEDIRLELQPLEEKIQTFEIAAAKRADFVVWAILFLMCVQFGGLSRLTWWEYSWDIMEPITYFFTYGTTIGFVCYYLLTRQEYMLPDVLNRRHLIALHKRAKRSGVDLNVYNSLKERQYELETTLKILRGPLYDYKTQLEQRRRERSSSSSSRSPSSSPSPSPSPSPERSFPKRGIFPEKEAPKKQTTQDMKYS